VLSATGSDGKQNAFPAGTGFSISNKHVLTARHNCLGTDGNIHPTIGLIKEVVKGENIERSTIVMLKHVDSSAVDDWAVFERVDGGEFAASVKICPECRLPNVRAPVGIKNFPAGLIDTNSTTKLTVASLHVKVYQYEKRLPTEDIKRPPKRSAPFFMEVVDSACVPSPAVEDVIMVAGGRVAGSCGAPYFNMGGEVVAFHFESVDDSEPGSKASSRSSHYSYSHGYVLCRLPSFVAWYESSIGVIT